MDSIAQKSINAIRILSAEAIQRAKSGHPGLPLGLAPLAYTLWGKHLSHNPKDPKFFNRDRFVLSAGHGSMLLYSLLHLFGYGLTKEDLMQFRQLDSLTPGHPEYRHTAGVETTTGPLGQGVANAVGMAMAESYLAAKFNEDGYNIVDHYTYVIASDGCMMEGIESEAASLAGTWKLNKLIVFYDSNNISIEGSTDLAFTENVAKRHEAQGWNVFTVEDGNDIEAISKAIDKAKQSKDKPNLIIVKTVIGYGSPLAGSAESHGAPLGEDNLKKTKEYFGWDCAPFEVPNEVKEHYAHLAQRGQEIQNQWNDKVAEYAKKFPEKYKEFVSFLENKAANLENAEELWQFENKSDATRSYGGKVLVKLSKLIPNLVGGSADLSPSTKTYIKGLGSYSKDNRLGRNLHFGVREHAMGAICNGIYLHGGLRAYCSTFFVFSDYMKHAIRLSAIMDIPVLYIMTHDSIGVGEDGPTHQPIEQLAGLRAVPNLKVYRPADEKETTAAYVSALSSNSPSVIVLTRQNVPVYQNNAKDALKGGYIIKDSQGTPECILIASGSEVEQAMQAAEMLEKEGIAVRVVSMLCQEVFDAQSKEYKESVLPSSVRARVAIESASTISWYKYVGLDGAVIGMDRFGKSGPMSVLFEHFGFTAQNIAVKTKEVIVNLKKS